MQPDAPAKAGRKALAVFRVNGDPHEVAYATHHTLLEVLREDIGLTGTTHGCELGECGACTVLVDGKPILSCLMLAVEAAGRDIRTVEGLADGPDLHPLQDAFADLGASQCGYCSSGFMLSAQALLHHDPDPDRETIRRALAGNICRCTGYIKIFEAVELAAARLRGEDRQPTEESLHGS
jgi:carbon-monoxide dehydrogenase small subunit